MSRRVLLLKNRTTPRDPYYEAFVTAGFDPTFIPLLEHGHVDREKSIEYLKSSEFLRYPVVIITSQRAVECLNECLEYVDTETRQMIHTKTIYTVGPATTKVLRDAGFTAIRGGSDAGNGLALSDIIIRDVEQGTPSEMIFFTGEIRKDIIPRRLLSANIALVEKVLYNTRDRPDIVDNFHSCRHGAEWVVFFSPQGTDPIVRHLQSQLQEEVMPFVASIGPTTEEYLQLNGLPIHTVAAKPEASSLIAAIESYTDVRRRDGDIDGK